jgi:hypothetical protein
MIFQPASILLALSLGTSAVTWINKLNSDIFELEVEKEREGVTIDEDEECRPGFFCMIFEDDGLERNIEQTIEVSEKVEYNTRLKKINYVYLIFFNYKGGYDIQMFLKREQLLRKRILFQVLKI